MSDKNHDADLLADMLQDDFEDREVILMDDLKENKIREFIIALKNADIPDRFYIDSVERTLDGWVFIKGGATDSHGAREAINITTGEKQFLFSLPPITEVALVGITFSSIEILDSITQVAFEIGMPGPTIQDMETIADLDNFDPDCPIMMSAYLKFVFIYEAEERF